MKPFVIKSNKWHYKLHNIVRSFPIWIFGDDDKGIVWFKYSSVRKRHPKSLCGYFWSTILFSILAVLLAILITGLALVVGAGGILLAPIWVPIFVSVYLIRKYNAHKKASKKEAAEKFRAEYIKEHGEKAWWVYLREKDRRDELEKQKVPKEPNLFFEYLKARKAKVCPLIIIEHVVDENFTKDI